MDAIEKATGMIKGFESCRLKAYKPTPKDRWTVGWGATGPDIGSTTVWTQQQADDDLANRIRTLSYSLRSLITTQLTINQVAALLSLVYNIGINAFTTSTLRALINAGKLSEAADQFLKWDHQDGQVIAGLDNRRHAEREVFLEA